MKLATKKILIIIDCKNFLVRIIMQKVNFFDIYT